MRDKKLAIKVLRRMEEAAAKCPNLTGCARKGTADL